MSLTNPEEYLKSFLSEGYKLDQGKPDFSLIPPDAMLEVAKVLTLGASKYGAKNWQKGLKYSRLTAAIHRHMNAWQRGEDKCPEDGQYHLSSVIVNALFLLAYQLREGTYKEAFDDREVLM